MSCLFSRTSQRVLGTADQRFNIKGFNQTDGQFPVINWGLGELEGIRHSRIPVVTCRGCFHVDGRPQTFYVSGQRWTKRMRLGR